MASINLSTKGISQLEKKLASLSNFRLAAVREKQLAQLLERARKPGGTPVDSGELRKSSVVSGDVMGYTTEYAPHVEYGHRTRNGGFVTGQRFLQKNVEIQRRIYKEDIESQIKKLIKKG